MPKTLRICPSKCGCGQKGGEEREEGEERGPSPMEPIGTTCELWVRLDASVKGM